MVKHIPKTIKEARDPLYMRQLLHELVQERFGTSFSIHDIIILPHKNRQHLLHYEVIICEEDKLWPTPWRIVAKLYEDPEIGQRCFNTMRQLRNHNFLHRSPTWVRVPEAYAYISDLELLLMEEIPGKPMKKLVRKRIAGIEHMYLFSAAIVKLHRFPSFFEKPFGVTDHLKARCHSLEGPMADAFPEMGGDIRRIVETAKKMEAEAGIKVFTLAHGDCHLAQVHMDDDLWILDIDPVHYGDPAYDIAMILFNLKQMEKATQESTYIRSLRDAFVSYYFSEMDWEIASRVAMQEALIHLKRACKRFRWQDEDGWQDTVRIQIGQSIACLQAMEQLPKPRSVSDMAKLYELCPEAL